MVKGSAVPMNLYTVDIGRLHEFQMVDLIANKRVILTTKNLTMLHQSISPDFFKLYAKALNLYLGGRWREAIIVFTRALAIRCVRFNL